ncbi:hypothetical protein ACROYT_G036949 [Oculina patagonica]
MAPVRIGVFLGLMVMAQMVSCREIRDFDEGDCQKSLGLENYAIPDSSITASSFVSPTTSVYMPGNGRLNFRLEPGRVGAWAAGNLRENSWFQVDFGRFVKVTMVATQGRQDAYQWVTKYRVSYSNDGNFFEDYDEGGYVKTFDGNTDRDTIVRNKLQNPIITRYIRINPISYYHWISLRADFYGCTSGTSESFLRSWYAYIALRVEFYGCAANNGGYSQWGDWTKCSVSCGTGQRSRSRTCTNPPPSSGGKDCSGLGPDKETGECDSGGCPVDGGYSDWAPYDKCSKTCGGGVQTRKRTCTNPPPASSGKDCSGLGPDTSTRECNTMECPKKTWTPVGCYENRGRALADILFKPKRIAKIPKKYEQCKAQADKKGVTVFGLDDSKCWTGQNAASSYDMYGLAKGKCGNTRKGLRYGFVASGTIFVYQKEGGVWKPLDCFNNVSPQDAFALPESFDNNVGSVTGPDAIFDYCKEKAEALGYKMFGADDKSCWSGDDAESTYNKYGESTGCTFSKKTGHGSGQDKNGDVFVYKLE